VNGDVVEFDRLAGADLVLDRVYRGGTAGGTRDDPLCKLLPVGNQGGFRPAGSPTQNSVKLAVLYTTGEEADWPDALDPLPRHIHLLRRQPAAGPGARGYPQQGEPAVEQSVRLGARGAAARAKVPPFLLFDKPGGGRDVRFRGLLAPGSDRLSGEEDLVAVWRTTSGVRFQNYQARFTVLKTASVTRAWIEQLMAGQPLGGHCPAVWRGWVEQGIYDPLTAPPTVIVRGRDQQQPAPADRPLLDLVYQHFKDRPYDFEQFAADLWRVSEPNVDKIDVTRPWRDGGRDAVGEYLLGPHADPVAVEFALEAKCYAPTSSVGVRETSRLISRLRHRQFGVLVTTSYLDGQAYKEIRDDGHPVVVLAGRDVIERLKVRGLDNITALRQHLNDAYPPHG
jgi:hypothetical protein